MTDSRKETLLLVDDDPNVLASITRQFRGKYNIVTAGTGAEALELIDGEGPFAVVISDMRMPGMDGVQFLARVSEVSPDTVRIMLTGNADQETAIEAVNKSRIFRFLVKPCDKETLDLSIAAGFRQYRLLTAERELLEMTLSGSVKLLIDMLSLVNPVAFSRASRVKQYCRQMAEHLQVKTLWQFELAALLSQIGCVTLPADVLSKVDAGDELPGEEKEMFQRHPVLGQQLLKNIPRLEIVARAIGGQQKSFREYDEEAREQPDDGDLGAMLLKAMIDFDTLIAGGCDREKAIIRIKKNTDQYYPKILESLSVLTVIDVEQEIRTLPLHTLSSSMVLAEDILTRGLLLLAKKGQEITPTMKMRLENYAARDEIDSEIRVAVPHETTAQESNEPLPLPN